MVALLHVLQRVRECAISSKSSLEPKFALSKPSSDIRPIRYNGNKCSTAELKEILLREPLKSRFELARCMVENRPVVKQHTSRSENMDKAVPLDEARPNSQLKHDKATWLWTCAAIGSLPWLLAYWARHLWIAEFRLVLLSVPIALILVYRNWDRAVHWPNRFGNLLLGAAIVASLSAVGLGSLWMASCAALLVIGAWLVSHQDRTQIHLGLLYLWPCFWLMVGLPPRWNRTLQGILDQWSIDIASRLLDDASIVHRIHAGSLELVAQSFSADQIIQRHISVFLLLALSLYGIAWLKRSPALIPCYILFSAVCYTTLGVLQMIWIAAMAQWHGQDWTFGWRRGLLTLAMAILAGLLLFSADRLIRFFSMPATSQYVDTKRANPLVIAWNWLFADLNTPTEHAPVKEAQ